MSAQCERPALPPTQAAIEHLLRHGPCKTNALAAALGVPGGKVSGLLKYALMKGNVQRLVIKEPQALRTSVWSLPGRVGQ